MANDSDVVNRKKRTDVALPLEAQHRAASRNAAKRPHSKPRSENNPGLVPPPFTLKSLKDSIPAHCFKRSALRSSLYVLYDFIGIAILFFFAQQIDKLALPTPLHWALWGLYWIAQGIIMTGVWVIAHECGHQAFSESKTINDTVGLILHSMLLVPYHSWRISHGKHHKNTNHLELDEVFVPITRSEAGFVHFSALMKTPPAVALRIVLMLTIGWPAYLLFNIAGRKYESAANHFNPWSPIFLPKERKDVIVSDIALIVWLGILGTVAHYTSFGYVVKMYGIPYLFVNMWLVLITELQHTDAEIPHYDSEEWTWLRGALCTVDRDYGILNHFHHHIGDTHICHHIFSKIPHYHAEEATRHLKKTLGRYYRRDETPIAVALWKSMLECGFIEDNEHIAWYQSS
eukprot:TRINITY_DN556_c0_g1_i2.p1 TRINITY_DN556_c0_g1~~TRINITY_DN556_c0_g1_i2.p1  ORF type:complete len:402 (-),score=90.39 TRINITY_DN556_c0_g1_i2:85-1290(-)